jgi:hypothetical protein
MDELTVDQVNEWISGGGDIKRWKRIVSGITQRNRKSLEWMRIQYCKTTEEQLILRNGYSNREKLINKKYKYVFKNKITIDENL